MYMYINIYMQIKIYYVLKQIILKLHISIKLMMMSLFSYQCKEKCNCHIPKQYFMTQYL